MIASTIISLTLTPAPRQPVWTPAEFAAARAAVPEHDDRGSALDDEPTASKVEASAELEERRKVFIARALRDPRLAAGREAAALDRRTCSLRTALSIYCDAISTRDATIASASSAARSLGLTDDDIDVVGYRTGADRGLMVNGNRVAPSAGWARPAERALGDMLAMIRRAARSMH